MSLIAEPEQVWQSEGGGDQETDKTDKQTDKYTIKWSNNKKDTPPHTHTQVMTISDCECAFQGILKVSKMPPCWESVAPPTPASADLIFISRVCQMLQYFLRARFRRSAAN